MGYPKRQRYYHKSIRLKGYDYSKAGSYFVTFCAQDRTRLFGVIKDGEMRLNDAGIMIDKWWNKIPQKFPDIELGSYQIMPDHFHAIVINNGAVQSIPSINSDVTLETNEKEESIDGIMGLHVGSSLSTVVQWFKTMSTNEYIRGVKTLDWPSFKGKIWQRDYYECIIRNKRSFHNITNYINNNPAKWNHSN